MSIDGIIGHPIFSGQQAGNGREELGMRHADGTRFVPDIVLSDRGGYEG